MREEGFAAPADRGASVLTAARRAEDAATKLAGKTAGKTAARIFWNGRRCRLEAAPGEKLRMCSMREITVSESRMISQNKIHHIVLIMFCVSFNFSLLLAISAFSGYKSGYVRSYPQFLTRFLAFALARVRHGAG